MRRNPLDILLRNRRSVARICRELLQFAVKHRQVASAGKGKLSARLRIHLLAQRLEVLVHPLCQPRIAQRIK